MTQSDGYTWRPLWWMAGLTLGSVAIERYVDFVPCCGGVRTALELLTFLLAPGIAIFAVVVFLLGVVALVKARIRRAFSLALAVAALPLVAMAALRPAVSNPFYWYVLLNQSRLEAAAQAKAEPGAPLFADLEGQDASRGFSILGPLIIYRIVYDETDELGLDASKRSTAWNARVGASLSRFAGAPVPYHARHLRGHFYIVTYVP